MTVPARMYPTTTHDVTNQSGAFVGVNVYEGDTIFKEAVRREGAAWVDARASSLGAAAANPEIQEHSHLANKHLPALKSHDRFGNRVDSVEFHPSYHALMQLAFGSGVQSLSWTAKQAGGHVARAALSYIWNQIESGIGCPTGMAYSSIPTLRIVPEIAERWVDKVLAEDYDPRPVEVGGKCAATIGMALTEKQGGSDLRANSTQAAPATANRNSGAEYRLTGHKWFCSAPMSDAFLTLAQTEKGPACFFVPRSLPDGTRNRFFIQRLKDKCGNRSNASSEIEYSDTYGILVGEEGRGIKTCLEMAHLTRLDFSIGSAGLMRWALNLTLHHTFNRRTFQKTLADQPMMKNVLADLCLESEAATTMAFRLARHVDDAATSEHSKYLERIITPVAKFWNCKRAPMFVAECVECHGGNGFIEEQPMPRLYREAPLNGIWEGTGNMICLDVLRIMEKEPAAIGALLAELRSAKGENHRLDAYVGQIADELADPRDLQHRARQITVMIAQAYEAVLLLKHSIPAVADAYVASRLGGLPHRAFGSLPRGVDMDSIISRSRLS